MWFVSGTTHSIFLWPVKTTTLTCIVKMLSENQTAYVKRLILCNSNRYVYIMKIWWEIVDHSSYSWWLLDLVFDSFYLIADIIDWRDNLQNEFHPCGQYQKKHLIKLLPQSSFFCNIFRLFWYISFVIETLRMNFFEQLHTN